MKIVDKISKIFKRKSANQQIPITFKLVHAAQCNELDTVKTLLEKGKNINEQDNAGDTALIVASRFGWPQIVDLLIEKGANINKKNNNEDTALFDAVRSSREEIVRSLLKNGAAVDEKNRWGETALLSAVRSGNTQTATMLIEKTAHVDKTDNNGESALIAAVRYSYVEITHRLIEKGADVYQKDRSGLALIEIAQARGPEIATAVQDAIAIRKRLAREAAEAVAAEKVRRQHEAASSKQDALKEKLRQRNKSPKP